VIDDVYDVLLLLPVWGGPIFAMLVFAVLRWGSPLIIPPTDAPFAVTTPLKQMVGTAGVGAAPWVGTGILVLWLVAEFQKWQRRRLVESHTGPATMRALSWQDFEYLLGEAFRRQGYLVEQTGRNGPDGGVDLRLSRGQERLLVQCKHWKVRQVGVRVVRELSGVVASERATGGIVVTSGSFSADAKSFARTVPIRLIDGRELDELIDSVRTAPHVEKPTASSHPTSQLCPECGATMTVRTARRGASAGSRFWGCSKYPACRVTRPLSLA
jgi:restriction system protein